MDIELLEKVKQLRHQLHGLAECSGQEIRTKACLMQFLRDNTTLIIEDHGAWFCALHQEAAASETIAFRADMDALAYQGGAAHLCGHDGHSAILAGLGLYLEGKALGRNILLIFQHAEEIGVGGGVCCETLQPHNVARIYAFHNIPEWEEGAVLLRHGTFACASRGLVLRFTGKPTHAAYPENGVNPGFAAANVMAGLPAQTEGSLYNGLTMATLIGARIGEKAFGQAAADAQVWLTLRAWQDDDLQALQQRIVAYATVQAKAAQVALQIQECDVFPATFNDEATLQRLIAVCQEAGLPTIEVGEPFRWSEDFGYYGSKASAVMVGIGAGKSWPQLHTESYEFNDNLLAPALRLFCGLAQHG